MRSIFLADAHLRDPQDANYRELLAFLETLHGNTDKLFILGDLFDFWIGYPETAFPHYREILNSLLSLKNSGTEIFFFEGNHDFHLGPFFEEKLRARIFPRPATLIVEGATIHFCHGDEVNSGETGAGILRRILHSRGTRALTRIVPPRIAFRIADYLSAKSTGGRDGSTPGGIPDMIRRYADARLQEGSEVVVMGHFHFPLLETRPEGLVLALGEWIRTYSYGESDGEVFRLRSWPDGDSAALSIPKRAR
jgi:UDP-2,3-diacylglucosamine hydrolase